MALSARDLRSSVKLAQVSPFSFRRIWSSARYISDTSSARLLEADSNWSWFQIWKSLRTWGLINFTSRSLGLMSFSSACNTTPTSSSSNCWLWRFYMEDTCTTATVSPVVCGKEWVSLLHWEHGRCDSASALVCRRPRWWTILKLCCCKVSSHRAICPSGSLKFINQVSAPWSVHTVKFCPARNSLNCSTK